MTTSEKLTTIAENQQKVFESGQDQAWSVFWDILQNFGAKQGYESAFIKTGWNDTNFKPKYDIYASTLKLAFYRTNIEDLRGCMNRAGVKFNAAECDTFSQMFQQGNVKYVPEIDMTAAINTGYMFGTNCKVEEIDKIIVSASSKFDNVFNNSGYLREIRFEGVLGANNVSFQWCNNLSVESLVSILEVLEDKSSDASGTTWKITIGATNKAKLTVEQLLIAQNKGWQVN